MATCNMKSFALVSSMCLVLLGSASAQVKEGTFVMTEISDETGFGDISVVIDLNDDSSNPITMTKESSSFTGDSYAAGKYELCFYEYGGVTRNLELGNLFTEGSFTGCVGGVVDSALDFASTSFAAGPSLTKASDSSLVGRGAVLCKRSIAVFTDTRSSQMITVQLVDPDGTTVTSTTTGSTAEDYKDGATFVLDFDSNPTGTYTLQVSAADMAVMNLTIGEYSGDSQYWKSYMITDYDYSEENAEAFPAFANTTTDTNEYATLVADGWNFPASDTTTPSISVSASVLTHAAVGTVGIKNTGSNEAGGPTTDRIRCTFDDMWGSRAIYGQGLLTGYTSKFWLQSQISGLQCSMGVDECSHSFHFHTYGDIDGGNGAGEQSPSGLGDIVSSYSLAELVLSGSSSSVYYHTNVTTVGNFEDLVGVSLTVHDGPTSSSDTVAWGVCGIADPSSCMRYGCPDVEYEVVDTDGASSKSVASLAIAFASVLPIVYHLFE